MTPKIVPATMDHAHFVAENLCDADRAELQASSTKSAHESLIFSLINSIEPMTAMVDDEPILIFGAAAVSSIAPVGHPWMLTTKRAHDYPVWLGKTSKKLFLGVCSPFSYVFNYVDSRHTTAVKWLKWLGFNVLDPEPWGPIGVPFHKFEMHIQRYEVRLT